MRLCLFSLVLLVAAALAAAPAAAQEKPGAIQAIVFHDLNGDSVRDDDEPGLAGRSVELSQGGVIIPGFATDPEGISLFESLSPGEYTLTASLGDLSLTCSSGDFSFDPFPNSFCGGATLPWRGTTPDSVTVSVAAGVTTEVLFGAQPVEAAVITGLALLEDGIAPPGTLIEAFVNGQECGTAESIDNNGGQQENFVIEVLGASEREGCAASGDDVAFRVGGVLAPETLSWLPHTQLPSVLGFSFLNLTAIGDRAWYWYERSGAGQPGVGEPFQALVGGQVCGEAVVIEETQRAAAEGFSRLIVPSEEIQPACGRAGATVRFLVDGVELASLPWQPGVQRLDLGGAVGSPQLGSGPGAQGGVPIVLPLVAALAVAGGLFAAGGGLLVARRR